MFNQSIWEGLMDSEFLTAEEVAEFLRLPLSTVYKLVQDKKLPGFKVGKHWRFRREAFQEWIKQKENNSFASKDQSSED